MRLLLGSGGFSMKERLDPWLGEVQNFLGPVRRVLFIPYALADWDAYLKMMQQRWKGVGREIQGAHRERDPRRAARQAEAVFVGGGNTWRLLDALRRRGLLSVIRERVRRGMPYLGASAGTNAACPTIQTTNDMPIVHPGSFEALNLVPFQVNPHYFSGPFSYQENGSWTPYGGETRDDRLREFHEENRRPVIGLWEGTWLRVEGRVMTLGGGPARLFIRGKKSRDVRAGTNLSALLRA